MDEKDLQNIGEDFYTNMEDLTFNSRPIITNLTIIAEENTQAAPYIVKAVEKRIDKALHTQKLFAFYLLDSICKNIGSPYTLLFGDNLFKTFTSAYVSLDDPTRKKMIDLFKTWLTTKNSSGLPLFPQEPVKKIEEFLIRVSSIYQKRVTPPRQSPTPTSTPPVNTQELINLINSITLLSGEKLKIIPSDTESLKKLDVLSKVKQVIESQGMGNTELLKVKAMLQDMYKSEEEALKKLLTVQQQQQQQQQQVLTPPVLAPEHPLKRQFQQFVNTGSNPLGLAPIGNLLVTPKSNYDQLFQKLIKAKLIKYKRQRLPTKQFLKSLLSTPRTKQGATATTPNTTNTNTATSPLKNKPLITIDLTQFDINSSTLLKNTTTSYDTFHQLMFVEKPNKCAQCGKRFGKSDREMKLRADHLDWHFRVNSKLNQLGNSAGSAGNSGLAVSCKAWYLDDVAFFKFRDLEVFYSDGGSNITSGDLNDNKGTISNVKHYVPVPESSLDMQTQCGICRETIKGQYDDDLGEWVYKDATTGNSNSNSGKVFHWGCFSEANPQANNRSVSAGIKRKFEYE